MQVEQIVLCWRKVNKACVCMCACACVSVYYLLVKYLCGCRFLIVSVISKSVKREKFAVVAAIAQAISINLGANTPSYIRIYSYMHIL